MIPKGVFSFKVGHFYSPRYRHMICIGKAKSTSEKGLLQINYSVCIIRKLTDLFRV